MILANVRGTGVLKIIWESQLRRKAARKKIDLYFYLYVCYGIVRLISKSIILRKHLQKNILSFQPRF